MGVPSQKKRAKSEQVQLTLIQEKVVACIEEVTICTAEAMKCV